MRVPLLVATLTGALLGAAAMSGPGLAEGHDGVLTGEQAFGDWRQDKPGVRRLIRPQDVQKPDPSQSSANGADAAARPKDAVPQLPPGFSARLIASDIAGPRVVRVAPNGDLFVSDSRRDRVLVFRLGADGRKTERSVFADGLNQPYGIAFYPADHPQWIYVANADSVVRFTYRDGETTAAGEPETIVSGIPANHHWTRDIVFSPDGKTLYLSVGSGSNVAEGIGDEPPGGLDAWLASSAPGAAWGSERGRAEVRAYDPDGRNGRVYATGLRNCSGMTVQPATGKLWCVVNERDGLGDNVPFDYATSVEEGAFYGWPWYYTGDHEDPRHAGGRPDLAGRSIVPDVLLQAHSAPLNIAFYSGGNFPAEYKGDAFVALHGSWNRGKRTGYKVVRLRFTHGKPTGEYEDFMTGFVLSDASVWGRPVGVAVAKDGSLVVSEDGNGTLWQVTYQPAAQ